MDRKHEYYKHLVTETDANTWFDLVEQALWNVAIDSTLFGIVSGLAPSLASAPQVTITKGTAVDQAGRRVHAYSDGATSKTFSYATATDTTPTAVTAGQERWISIFAVWGRKQQDARVDGNGITQYYDQPEGVSSTGDGTGWDQFVIVAGTAAATGAGTRPALLSNGVLVCDIKRTPSDASNVLDTSRRQAYVDVSSHIAGTAGKHNASQILLTSIASWLGGRTNPDTDVAAMISKIINDLAATTSSDDGAERIGAQASGSLTAGSVRSQLDQLLALVTGVLTAGGNNTFTGTNAFTGDLTLGSSATQKKHLQMRVHNSPDAQYQQPALYVESELADTTSFLMPVLGVITASTVSSRLFMSKNGIAFTINAKGPNGSWTSDDHTAPAFMVAVERAGGTGGSLATLTLLWKAATSSSWAAWDTGFKIGDGTASTNASDFGYATNTTYLNAKTGAMAIPATGVTVFGPYDFGGLFTASGAVTFGGVENFKVSLPSTPTSGTVTASTVWSNVNVSAGVVDGVDQYGFSWHLQTSGSGAFQAAYRVSFTI